MIKGIDVSEWQGNIDWPKIKAVGIGFAIIRASFGQHGVDKKFEDNIKAAQAVGIPVGVYHYCYATNQDDARKEALHFIDTIKSYKLEYPVCLDLEDKCQDGLSVADLTDLAIAFLEVLENEGYFAAIYASKSKFDLRLDRGRLKPYCHWIAQWADKLSYDGDFGLWQYADDGKVDGINGNVDLDYAYDDYPGIIKSVGLNGFEKPGSQTMCAPAPKQEPVAKAQTYIVHGGDTLCSIAQKFLGSSMKYKYLAAINNIKDPNIIHVGQKIYLYKQAPTSAPVVAHTYYTVQPGDTMCSIAQKILGSSLAYKDIAAKNHISNPNLIHVGDKLLIK